MDEAELPLSTRMNLQTAPIAWPELERSFASGRVLQVATELDLIEVAVALAEDDTRKFTDWTHAGHVMHLQNDTARQWLADDSHLWAVVVAPWVLVQDRRDTV
ncbi:MAG: DUF2288 domain-containing protein [Thiolinea sp.]